MPRSLLMGMLCATLALSACGVDSRADANVVEAYCAYGADSEAQFQGCTEHVTVEQVRGYDTSAARFALDDPTSCPADASEYCEYWQEGERAQEDLAEQECEPSYYYGGRGGSC